MPTETMTVGSDVSNYKQKEEIWFDDGREERLLEYVRRKLSTTPAKPEEVIALIDQFGVNQNYMMNVGARKGQIVTGLIAQYKPRTMIELGGYIGYSTILFAAALRENGGQQFVSFEREPKFAHVAQALVKLAGLSDIVRLVVGPSSKNLVAENAAGRLSHADMIFLDHYKPAYVKDLKICESLSVVKVGSVLAADNVIEPGNPTYLEYVRSSPEEKQKRLLQDEESRSLKKFPDGTVNQYKKAYEADETALPGIPGIVYESTLVHSYEPTGVPDGVEVSVCKYVPAS